MLAGWRVLLARSGVSRTVQAVRSHSFALLLRLPKFLEFRSNPNAGLLQLPTGGNGRPAVILAERSAYLLREFSGQGGLLPAEIKFKSPNLSC